MQTAQSERDSLFKARIGFLVAYLFSLFAIGTCASLAERYPACPLLHAIESVTGQIPLARFCYRLDIPIAIMLSVIAILCVLNFRASFKYIAFISATYIVLTVFLLDFYIRYLTGSSRIAVFNSIHDFSFPGGLFVILGLPSLSLSVVGVVIMKVRWRGHLE